MTLRDKRCSKCYHWQRLDGNPGWGRCMFAEHIDSLMRPIRFQQLDSTPPVETTGEWAGLLLTQATFACIHWEKS